MVNKTTGNTSGHYTAYIKGKWHHLHYINYFVLYSIDLQDFWWRLNDGQAPVEVGEHEVSDQCIFVIYRAIGRH